LWPSGRLANIRYNKSMLTGILLLAGFAAVCLGLGLWFFARPAGAGAPVRKTPGSSHAKAAPGTRPGLPKWAWLLAAGALCLAVPPGVVWWWGTHAPQGRVLEAYDDQVAALDPVVVSLLRGEQLVPPPPLPPELFATAEVEVVRPMLVSADRRWEQMDAEFVQRLLLVFKLMKQEHGYDMALLEGFRSPERQARLAALGSQVTQAGPWQSYHQHGLAADCAFYRDGKLVITEKDAWAMQGYQRFGEVAERVGLVWGGRWRMMDLGHVEWRKPGVKLGQPARNTP
jgi:peptidoglycan L-alanyl-D-glutamate endopeptidase CwlK